MLRFWRSAQKTNASLLPGRETRNFHHAAVALPGAPGGAFFRRSAAAFSRAERKRMGVHSASHPPCGFFNSDSAMQSHAAERANRRESSETPFERPGSAACESRPASRALCAASPGATPKAACKLSAREIAAMRAPDQYASASASSAMEPPPLTAGIIAAATAR